MKKRDDGRHWMEIDEDAPNPSLTVILWLLVLIFAFIVTVGAIHSGYVTLP